MTLASSSSVSTGARHRGIKHLVYLVYAFRAESQQLAWNMLPR
jgi:hypothetical protein